MSGPRCDVEVAPSNNFRFSNASTGDLLFNASESNTGVYFGGATGLLMSVTGSKIAFGGSNGNVTFSNNMLGIGAATPSYPLDVNGAANVSGNLSVGGNFTVAGTTTTVNTQTMLVTDNIITLNNGQSGTPLSSLKSGVEVNRGTASNYYFLFEEQTLLFKVGHSNNLQAVTTRDDALSTGYPYYDSTQKKLLTRALTIADVSDAPWRYAGSNAYTMCNIGVGLSNPSYPLHVSGGIYATGDIIAFSDASVKHDLQVIADPLQKVSQLTGYTFTRADLPDASKRYAGLLAQEVQQVLPEVVYSADGQKLSVAYGNVVALLVEAIKELKAKVDELSEIRS